MRERAQKQSKRASNSFAALQLESDGGEDSDDEVDDSVRLSPPPTTESAPPAVALETSKKMGDKARRKGKKG